MAPKIFDKFKFMFSSKKENSPVQKVQSKTKHGNPISMNNSNNNSIQQANTINNHYSSQNEKVIIRSNDLKNLKEVFTNDVIKRIVTSVKDPKRTQKNCNDIKNFIQGKFEAIQLSVNDPKKKNLTESYEQVIILLESFIQDEISENQFIEEWIKIGDNL